MVTWMELEEKAAKLAKMEVVVQKLYDAINTAGFAVMQTSGEWSIHDISKLAGKSEAASSGKQSCLNKQHLAAHLGPSHTGRNTCGEFLSRLFRMIPGRSQILL